MKRLSAIVLSALFTCLMFTAVVYTSCNKSDCYVTCENGGNCKDGACQCPSGFSGLRCEIDDNACNVLKCKNGGQCLSGKCVCPTGFSGKECEIDACANIECKNGGKCRSGKCDCADGYEGANCETMMRTKFLGTWKGTALCPAQEAMSITINEDTTGADLVRLYYASNSLLFNVQMKVSANSLSMAQPAYISTDQKVQLTVNVTGNTITFGYTLEDAALNSTKQCQGTASK